MHYVFSTISTDVKYTFYGQSANDMPAIEHTITIKGGANVATKNLITPRGVMTAVEDADIDMLNTHPVFLRHKKMVLCMLKQNLQQRMTWPVTWNPATSPHR